MPLIDAVLAMRVDAFRLNIDEMRKETGCG